MNIYQQSIHFADRILRTRTIVINNNLQNKTIAILMIKICNKQGNSTSKFNSCSLKITKHVLQHKKTLKPQNAI